MANLLTRFMALLNKADEPMGEQHHDANEGDEGIDDEVYDV